MEKVVKFLEKNVEWFALGIGGIFLLTMVWFYVLQKPVFVQLTADGDKLTPGEIDQRVVDGPVTTLETAINSITEAKIPVDPFDVNFKDFMARKGQTVVALGPTWPSGQAGTNPEGPIGLPPIGPNGIPRVENLPIPPVAVFDAQSFGRSTLEIPNGQADQKNPAQLAFTATDRQWWSALFTVSSKDIANAFVAANIPPNAQMATFLEIDTVRQEVLADGTLGPEVPVPALVTQSLQKFPAAGAAPIVVLSYFDWASKNTEDIVHPKFYQVAKGDAWQMPGVAKVNLNAQPEVDPKIAAEEKKLKEEERKRQEIADRKAKAEQNKARQKNPTPNPNRRPTGVSGGPPGAAPPGGGGGSYPHPAIRDGEKLVEVAQVHPSGGYPGATYPGPTGSYPSGGYPGATMPGPGGGRFPQAAAPSAPQPGMAPAPAGAFNPAITPDVQILVHDDSAEAGKTYRYKVRYKLRNPIYGAVNVANNKALANTLAIESPWSELTPPVTFPTRTNFWIAANGVKANGSVRFEIFTWKAGEQLSKPVTVAPGDAIGDLDFSTGWTLVDSSYDNKTESLVVILTDETGHTVKRDWNSDKDDPEYKSLRDEIEKAKPPADGAAAAAGGRQ